MSRLDRVGLLSFLLLFVVIGLGPQALAHTNEDYWTDGGIWPNGDVAYDMEIKVPGGLGSAQHDAIARGGQDWNALTNRITFKRSGVEVAHFSLNQTCNHPNTVHWHSLSTNLAAVTLCYNIFSTRIVRFGMEFDDDRPWYYGDSGIPDSSWMISGVSSHEFGHASGGWIEDPADIGHYDAAHNPNLCGISLPGEHTMCQPNRFQGTSYQGTLEPHDIDLFQFHY
jgi:hypothetical protein